MSDTRNFETLYKEARLGLESPPSSVVHVRFTSGPSSTSSSLSRATPRPAADDEKAYRANNLATASSIYYRKYHSSPRGIIWRVLENGTILSLRAADVRMPSHNDVDPPLTLNLHFPNGIRPGCIGFSDHKGQDALCIYAIDQANQLYSITLRPDHFKKRSATDGGGMGEACKTYSPPGFGFKHPHRLVVVNPDQLIVTMHDGGILRFDKNNHHDATNGSPWKETIYNVAGWGQSLRGLVPFQRAQTVRHNKLQMELTAATSTIATDMDTDNSFLFTLCLDHRMRIWDIRTGQILYTGDILNAKRDPQEDGMWQIDPTQSNLIQIVEGSPGQCLVVTFSPIGAGEFKFWKVKANDQGSLHVADCFPGSSLIPASPSSLDVWTMADFAVTETGEGPDLWTMWKNNTTYRVQKLQIDPRNSTAPFGDGWKGVTVDNALPLVQTSGPCDPTDSTEKWLELIFYPGRFSRATLETALAMYERGLGTYKETSSRAGKTLAESVCSVLGSTTTLDRTSSGAMDYEQFRGTSETQWIRFWRLLLELDKQRGEALSLVFDKEDGMIWVLCADYIAAIRQCSDLDRIYHNIHAPKKKDEDVAALVSAGLAFSESFNDSMVQLSKAALRAEIYEDSALSDEDRMQKFWDKAAFWRQITDEDCAQVVETLGQNFRVVTPRLYEDLFDLITSSSEANSQELRQPFTGLGKKVLIRAVQETAELHWQILFSQLLLLVHMEFEIENEDEMLHTRFDVGLVYRRLVEALRRLEHVKWMATTQLTLSASKAARSLGTSSPVVKRSGEDRITITALEGLAGHLFGLPENSDVPLLATFTDIVLDLCAPTSSTVLHTSLLQCSLLKHDRPDLALELGPFADQDPFSTYVQGRVFLALKDYDAAALYFRKASIGLSISMKHVERHSAGLLDDTEWNLLNSGLANYYAHIVSVFDKQKAYSHVVEFSRLALQFTQPNSSDASARTKTEMLSRLFTAATTISHFDVAHNALLAMDDEAMQKSYLRRLIERMCESGQNAELIHLPFSGLQTQVDDMLLERAKATKDIIDGVPYHQILYAWRISHNDYRGAAAVLLDRLQRLRLAGEGDDTVAGDALDTLVTRQYLLLINALSCVDPKEAYILEEIPAAEQTPTATDGADDLEASLDALVQQLDFGHGRKNKAGGGGGGDEGGSQVLAEKMAAFSARYPKAGRSAPRRFLTLADLRKQYQQELDRIVAIQNNQFGLEDGDDIMDLVT